MVLGLSWPNERFDISSTWTIGIFVSIITGINDPGVAVTSIETSSAAIKLPTPDWCQEETWGDQFIFKFTWTLQSFAGVQFTYPDPRRTKVSIFKRKPATSMFKLPFNSDGTVTFTEEQFPKKIEWTLAPELAGTEVTWFVSGSVHLTMFNRSTGEGITLEFRFPDHLLHKMITDVECTHT